MGTKTSPRPRGRSLDELLAPVEESIEVNFFAPLAGPERTHEPGAKVAPLPWVPMAVIISLTGLLLGVFLATLLWPMVDPVNRPPPQNYYPGADVTGLVVTLTLFCLLAWSYLAVALTDPGRVPRIWPWDPKQPDPRPDADLSLLEHASVSTPLTTRVRGLERKLDGRTRFCKKCRLYKPDRTHHCKKLGRCVLEMDHWCPWVRNTVGYRNRKYFFLAVTYGWMTLFAYCVVLGPYLRTASGLQSVLDYFIIFCYILAVLECGLLLALWTFHIFLTVHAFTTIEFREKHLAKETKVARSGDKLRELYKQSLYDLGVYQSFKHLLGPNVLLWWIPTRYGMPNDINAGAVYKVREDHPLVQLAATGKKGLNTYPEKPLNSESMYAVENT